MTLDSTFFKYSRWERLRQTGTDHDEDVIEVIQRLRRDAQRIRIALEHWGTQNGVALVNLIIFIDQIIQEHRFAGVPS